MYLLVLLLCDEVGDVLANLPACTEASLDLPNLVVAGVPNPLLRVSHVPRRVERGHERERRTPGHLCPQARQRCLRVHADLVRHHPQEMLRAEDGPPRGIMGMLLPVSAPAHHGSGLNACFALHY